MRRLAATAAVWLAAGCNTAPPGADRGTVSADLTARVGQSVPCETAYNRVVMPPGASFDDGLTEDEAVAIALYNNALFQETLADLGLARGDLVGAGLLTNPEFVYFFPATDKPYKYLFDVPLEAIWLRPIRVRAAARDSERAGHRLAQAGLDLMRDTRQAYADVLLARERVRVAQESVALRGRVAELAGKRLAAGDIAPQEAATAQIDALAAQQDAARLELESPIFEERLRNLMGTPTIRGTLPLDAGELPPLTTFDADALAREAMATRPDALAAAVAVAGAEARLRLAKVGWVRFLGLFDATSGRNTGHEFSPAFRVTLPIFNQNQGVIARAESDLDRARRNQTTVANQIVLDVERGYLQYRQTCVELEMLRTKVRPEVQSAIKRAQVAYQEGNVPYLIVLETTRQLLDNYLREAVLNGDLRRFYAELERGVGRRLAPRTAAPPPAELPKPPAPDAPDAEKPGAKPAPKKDAPQP